MRDLLISVSVLVLGSCLMRMLFMGRMSMRHIYSIWLGVLVSLCIIPLSPWMPEGAFSILNVTGAVEDWWEERQAKEGLLSEPWMDDLEMQAGEGTKAAQTKGQPSRNTEGNRDILQAGQTGETKPGPGTVPPENKGDFGRWFRDEIWRKPVVLNRNPVFWGIWAAGALLTAAWMLAVNRKLKEEILGKRVPLGRRSSIRFTEGWARLPIYLVKDLGSPCLLKVKGEKGIYIPDSLLLEPESLRHAIAHETCHSRQGDLAWNRVRCIFLAVYWFHPLVWLAAWLSRQDCELSCDEMAIGLLGEKERFAYGRTLLSLVGKTRGTGGMVCGGTWMTAGGRQLKTRISRIARGSRITFLGVLGFYFMFQLVFLTSCSQSSRVEEYAGKSGSSGELLEETDGSKLEVQDIRPLGSGVGEEENVRLEEELAGFLVGNHLAYVGDAVGSGRIVGACLRAAGFTANASTELETSREPFAYRLIYREEDKGQLDEEKYKAVSILAFASIDNLGALEIYTGPDGIRKGELFLRVERKEAMEFYGLTDLSVYGQSAEEMQRLVQMVEEQI